MIDLYSSCMQPDVKHPTIIQGGMGIAVSSWQLAKQVAMAGELGVISGTAIDSVVARRLQDGDPAGDIRRGQSLIVWAIREGRQCARAVDEFLMGTSTLPR